MHVEQPHETRRLLDLAERLELENRTLWIGQRVTYRNSNGILWNGTITGFGIEAGEPVIDVQTDHAGKRWGWEDQITELEGERMVRAASEKPAADPPSVREPNHPGELIRTREGVMEYARRWAAFYLTLPADKQDDFIVETEALINLAKSLNPESYPVFKEAVNPSKGKAA